MNGQFTTANAKEMAARAAAAKREAAEQRRAEAEAPPPKPNEMPDDSAYVRKQLLRVRALLDSIDAQLAVATEPLDRERLARASCTLAERERNLAGRPLPGSRRPGKERAAAEADLVPLG